MRRWTTALLIATLAASPVAARQEEPAEPTAILSGHVMLKDGITPFPGARLVLTRTDGDEQFESKTARSGHYKTRLPVGAYSLKIIKGMEIYTAPSVYRISAGVRNRIDFLVIPDFEQTPEPGVKDEAAIRGPDPVREAPEEVGTVVDVMRERTERPWRRWAETLGFIGSLLLVGLAAGG